MDLASATTVAFVNVADRDRALAFYRGTLGLELVATDAFGDLLASGGATVRLTALPDHRPTGHPVLGWEVRDLEDAMALLERRGVAFTIFPGFGQDERGIWTSPDGRGRLAWFADPDGNALVLSSAL